MITIFHFGYRAQNQSTDVLTVLGKSNDEREPVRNDLRGVTARFSTMYSMSTTTSSSQVTSTASNRDSPTIEDEHAEENSGKRNLTILYEESKDVFDLLPTAYLPDYKSFCWYDSEGEFQCLASVYLAGMPKCGTTDLYDKLMWHPELSRQAHRMKETATQKEFFYWTRSRIGRPENFLAHPKTPLFKFPFEAFLAGTGAEKVKDKKELRILDGTPSLLWDLRDWEKRYPGLEEPPYSNADLIHAVTPDAKILAILRNPVDRLYSEYIYFWSGVGNDRSPIKFHSEVVTEINKFKLCLVRKSFRHCCYSSDHSLRLRIALGVYVCYVRDFLEVFGDNFLAITTHEYHAYPIETLNAIFNHIGVSEPNLLELNLFIESSKTNNVNSEVKERVGEMLGETRELLKKFYEPYNSELAALLQDSKYLFI